MRSIVTYPERGNYGNSRYRGNATGKLLLDLHKVYKFDEISDYMSGSFTTHDVGNELGIITNCYDLNGLRGEETKFDLVSDEIRERNKFIFLKRSFGMGKKILEFNDYVKIIVVNEGNFFTFYEEKVNPSNLCSLKVFVTKVRLEHFNNENIEYFKKIFNDNKCMCCVNGIMFI